jgi:Uma2 family endonuclease
MNAFAAGITVPRKVKLTVDDFLALDARGAFDDYSRTELIDGDVYAMNAQHRRHARVKTRLAVALAGSLESFPALEAIVEPSVAIPPHDAPEPDIVVTSEPDGEGLVPLSSVRLVVEVSDSTLGFDLGAKAAIYARAAVPEYWVVDVVAGSVHQLWSPGADGYNNRRTVRLGEVITAVSIAGLEVELPAR